MHNFISQQHIHQSASSRRSNLGMQITCERPFGGVSSVCTPPARNSQTTWPLLYFRVNWNRHLLILSSHSRAHREKKTVHSGDQKEFPSSSGMCVSIPSNRRMESVKFRPVGTPKAPANALTREQARFSHKQTEWYI